MSIDALQLRLEIIRPVLKHLEPEIPYSMAAENLLMGTCAQESRMGQWLVQLGDGPAKGIFQMEDATHDDINDENDISDNYLRFRNHIDLKIDALRIDLPTVAIDEPLFRDTNDLDAINLTGNLYYAAAMCRVHYMRVPKPLPDADNVYELAKYWKAHYNTNLGKGKVEEFIKNYGLFVA